MPFKKGQSGNANGSSNAAREKARIKREFKEQTRLDIRNYLNEEDFTALFRVMVQVAKSGDVSALRFLLSLRIGTPQEQLAAEKAELELKLLKTQMADLQIVVDNYKQIIEFSDEMKAEAEIQRIREENKIKEQMMQAKLEYDKSTENE